MRRADRLFQIVQYLRGGRLVTGQRLAERLEVSTRTIYRDICDLKASGVPIEGETGVGYVLKAGFDLPPLMFTRDEIVALVVGARLAQAWAGAATARAAQDALQKIETVLPDAERARLKAIEIHAFDFMMTERDRDRFDQIEQAIESRRVQRIRYRDQAGADSEREIWPLGLWFWGKVWTLVTWCELRADFRVFRLDRIAACEPCQRTFEPAPGQTLADFERRMQEEQCREPE